MVDYIYIKKRLKNGDWSFKQYSFSLVCISDDGKKAKFSFRGKTYIRLIREKGTENEYVTINGTILRIKEYRKG